MPCPRPERTCVLYYSHTPHCHSEPKAKNLLHENEDDVHNEQDRGATIDFSNRHLQNRQIHERQRTQSNRYPASRLNPIKNRLFFKTNQSRSDSLIGPIKRASALPPPSALAIMEPPVAQAPPAPPALEVTP